MAGGASDDKRSGSRGGALGGPGCGGGSWQQRAASGDERAAAGGVGRKREGEDGQGRQDRLRRRLASPIHGAAWAAMGSQARGLAHSPGSAAALLYFTFTMTEAVPLGRKGSHWWRVAAFIWQRGLPAAACLCCSPHTWLPPGGSAGCWWFSCISCWYDG